MARSWAVAVSLVWRGETSTEAEYAENYAALKAKMAAVSGTEFDRWQRKRASREGHRLEASEAEWRLFEYSLETLVDRSFSRVRERAVVNCREKGNRCLTRCSIETAATAPRAFAVEDEARASHRAVAPEFMLTTRLWQIVGPHADTARYFDVFSNLECEDASVPPGLYFTGRVNTRNKTMDHSSARHAARWAQDLFYAPPTGGSTRRLSSWWRPYRSAKPARNVVEPRRCTAPTPRNVSWTAMLVSLGTILQDFAVAHNLGVSRVKTPGSRCGVGLRYVGLGGSHSRYPKPTPSEIDAYVAPSLASILAGAWRYLNRTAAAVPRRPVRRSLVFDGSLEGCYDRRAKEFKLDKRKSVAVCQFDGLHSVVRHKGKYLIYSRTNLKEHGGRYTQVAFSRSDDPLGAWDRFHLVTFQNLPNTTRDTGYLYTGNVYFAAVNANPVDPERSLLALLPVFEADPALAPPPEDSRWPPRGVSSTSRISSRNASAGHTSHKKKPADYDRSGRGYVGLALSCDGIHFSEITPLVHSPAVLDGRSIDVPVDGFAHHGDQLFFFVHRNVPGFYHPDLALFEHSMIAQYELNVSRLLDFTRDAKASLGPSCVL